MGSIIGGATQIVGSMVGGGARRREQRAARADFQQQQDAFRNVQFSNEFAGLENFAEDLTVNQQASQFQAQQTDAALAQGLDAIVAGGGGGGGAQAIAAAALQSKQGISANIAQQEAANQAARAQEAARLQTLEARGADDLQLRQYSQRQQLMGMAKGRLDAANMAREQATAGLLGGIGQLAGGLVTGGVLPGGGAIDEKIGGAINSGLTSARLALNSGQIASERAAMSQRDRLAALQTTNLGG